MKIDKNTSTPMEVLGQYLRERGQRLTSERILVVDAMLKHRGTFTPDDIVADMEKNTYAVSRATVYNTVTLLIGAGLVDCLRVPSTNSNVYAIRKRNSSHIYYICNNCGKVRAADADKLVKMIGAYDFRTFTPQAFAMCAYGLCHKCSKQKKQKKSNQQ